MKVLCHFLMFYGQSRAAKEEAMLVVGHELTYVIQFEVYLRSSSAACDEARAA
jgi:hypothetical protein